MVAGDKRFWVIARNIMASRRLDRATAPTAISFASKCRGYRRLGLRLVMNGDVTATHHPAAHGSAEMSQTGYPTLH